MTTSSLPIAHTRQLPLLIRAGKSTRIRPRTPQISRRIATRITRSLMFSFMGKPRCLMKAQPPTQSRYMPLLILPHPMLRRPKPTIPTSARTLMIRHPRIPIVKSSPLQGQFGPTINIQNGSGRQQRKHPRIRTGLLLRTYAHTPKGHPLRTLPTRPLPP